MAKPGNMPLHDMMQVTISVAGVRAQLKRRYNSASTSLWASSSFTGQLGRGLFYVVIGSPRFVWIAR